MATVGVTIAGRVYRMACDEGEEGHLQELAHHVDATLALLREDFGEIGDQRLAMMTAIKIADQLSEAEAKIAMLEAEAEELRSTKTDGDAVAGRFAEEAAAAVTAAAERIERIARDLNGTGRR